MRIGILCNSNLAIPSIQTILQLRNQAYIGMPSENAKDDFEIESFANQFGVQVSKFRKDNLNQELIFWKTTHNLDYIFVITFPYILSKKVISAIGIPIINFHFAPLPQYKGAQPVFWILKNGAKHGGISAHLITEEIDSGPLLHIEPYTLTTFETFGSYLSKMSFLNSKVIQILLHQIDSSSFMNKNKSQKKSDSNYYKKPQFNDVKIDWEKMKSYEIERLCRACNPWNKGALSFINNGTIKLVEVKVLELEFKNDIPGKLIILKNKDKPLISTIDRKFLEIGIVYDEQNGFYSGDRASELGLVKGSIFS